MDKDTDIGPMASKAQLKNTVEKVALAKEQGARILIGDIVLKSLQEVTFFHLQSWIELDLIWKLLQKNLSAQ